MTTGGFRVTALRVKLPCDDEKDFYARLADTIAEKGLRVPTPNLRPVGTRVRVVLEFRNAQTVSGEGIVDAHVEGPRPTMNVRLVKFERPRPGAGTAPAVTPAPGPALTPVPAPAKTPAGTPTVKPPPAAAEKPSPAPVAKPAPAAAEKPSPAPVAKPAPAAAEKPSPAPVAKSAPAAAEQPSPTPVAKSAPAAVEKPSPTPVAKIAPVAVEPTHVVKPAPAVERPAPTPAVTPVPAPATTPAPARPSSLSPTPAAVAAPAAATKHAARQAAEPTPAPAEASGPAEAAWAEAEAVPEVEPAAAEASEASAAPESSFASLLDEAVEEQAREPDAAPRPPAEGTEKLEPLYDAAPEPTPPPQTAAAAGGGALPAASRHTVLAAVAVAAALGVGILAYAIARRPASPAPDPAAVAAAAAADVEAQLVSRLAGADRRISEGRLSGPDGALDQLLAATALRPDDARVKDRLRLLADTLEMLGGRALERGDAAEAEVHLSAALRAAPDRQSISEKLRALGKLPVPGARSGSGAEEKAP